MARFSEESFNNWNKPASESEEQRISNALKMIKDAINSYADLRNKNIDIFVQGSYANNTNVRANSDIDVCIMLKDTFNDKYPDGLTREYYGFQSSSYQFATYRQSVIKALANKFGNDNIIQGNKSIKINSNSYRIETDAVPSFQYRNYRYENSRNPDIFVEGIKLIAQNGEEVINYPKQHIENGKNKNAQTQRQFKRLVRIFKRIRYHIIDNGNSVNGNISSFLIECLLWNVPNFYFNSNGTYTYRIEEIIKYLYSQTKEDEKCKEWREVSEILYLFHENRKWKIKTTNDFLRQMWNYLEFEN